MSMFLKPLVVIAITAVVALAPAPSRANAVTRAVPDFTVFVDPPTGFVFLKLPSGWTFVGRVTLADAAPMPSHVVTTLLDADDDR